jgi:hypothetical protein
MTIESRVRGQQRIVILAALMGFVLAGCQKERASDAGPDGSVSDGEAPVAGGETAPSPEPSTPPMRMKPVVFQPVSEPAVSATGALSLIANQPARPEDRPSMIIETQTGLAYEASLTLAGAGLTDESDWSVLFGVGSTELAASRADLTVDVYNVTSQSGGQTNPGLCGARAVKMLAIAVPIATDDGNMRLKMAVFGTQTWPPSDIGALCGVFTYDLPR